jgi:hypothetical protein
VRPLPWRCWCRRTAAARGRTCRPWSRTWSARAPAGWGGGYAMGGLVHRHKISSGVRHRSKAHRYNNSSWGGGIHTSCCTGISSVAGAGGSDKCMSKDSALAQRRQQQQGLGQTQGCKGRVGGCGECDRVRRYTMSKRSRTFLPRESSSLRASSATVMDQSGGRVYHDCLIIGHVHTRWHDAASPFHLSCQSLHSCGY